MNDKEVISTLSDIRNMMEKSTKFLSLDGSSSIFVGIYACIAAYVAYALYGSNELAGPMLNINGPFRLQITICFALLLLLICLLTAFALSYRKAKKTNRPLRFDKTARRFLWSFFMPLAVGGILCLSLIYQQAYGLTSSIMLIFYGLALVNASNYTYSHTRYLGYANVLLGLLDSFVSGYALLFWVLGFGVLHIVYGILFYLRYDRKRAA